jgi:hypothetical protein
MSFLVTMKRLSNLLEGLVMFSVKKAFAGVIIGGVMLIGITACAGDYPYVTEGEVIKKTFTEAHTEDVLQCMAFGPDALCSSWIYMPTYVGDSWDVRITADDVVSSASVSEVFYNTVEVGDYVDTVKETLIPR